MSSLNLSANIDQAVELLKTGKLVAFPTETVYGLGADAANLKAVEKIFTVKCRPLNHPLIVHLATIAQVTDWACDIPTIAWQLAERFWPGPLTLLLKRAPQVLNLVTGGQLSIALRIPSHPVAQALLQKFGAGIAAPSANRFGRISPTQAQHVAQELGNEVDLILEGGPCHVGIESTIVDLTCATPRVLRLGAILPSDLIKIVKNLAKLPHPSTHPLPRVPGSLLAHYAPFTPLCIVAKQQLPALINQLINAGKVISFITHTCRNQQPHNHVNWFKMPIAPIAYAQRLYAVMRMADNLRGDHILVEAVPATEKWSAIQERLAKAARP